MQNLVNEAPTKKNYDFIDAIRGIAMMSIVAEHCVTDGGYTYAMGSAKFWTYLGLVQFTKFGTIAFFLLAGFLISEKFADYSPGQYLKRRVVTTFGPWLFWSVLYLIALTINLYVKERIYHDGRFNADNILLNVQLTYLRSNYWFIINFLISLSVLLIFRRYLYSLYLGAMLGMFTLFYTINIHYEWVSPFHTTAILGFVFFLWLGAQMRRHWQRIEHMVQKTPYAVLIFLLLITFALAMYETVNLTQRSVDPFNTLRFSNILHSLVSFALLLKIKTFRLINYLKPRQTTFGIYLIHYIIIIILLPEIFSHFHIDVPHLSVPGFLLLRLADFIIAYGLALALVMLINKTRARVLVGN